MVRKKGAAPTSASHHQPLTAVTIGIDPGQTNCGVAVLNSATGELVAARTEMLCTRATFTDVRISQEALRLMRRLKDAHPAVDQVCVEWQWTGAHNQKTQAALITAAMAEWGLGAASTVAPMTLKSHFALGCHGHFDNKRAAMAATSAMGYPVDDDHKADAILCALYWLHTQTPPF